MHIHPARFCLPECIDAAVKCVSAAGLGVDIRITADIDPQIPERLFGDDVRLRQVLINLLGNAVKFNVAGGRVDLQVVRGEGAGADSGEDIPLCFSISDSGIGIDEAKLEEIFAPFSQVDGSITRQYGGTGLGLSISRRLVELMGGRLLATSQPGEGSVFCFTVHMQAAGSQGM